VAAPFKADLFHLVQHLVVGPIIKLGDARSSRMAQSTGSPVLRNRCAADAIISRTGMIIVNVAIVIDDANVRRLAHLRRTHSQTIPPI